MTTTASIARLHAKPLLVGEANPYGSDPAFALYPSPPGCSGERLCRLILGLDPDDYLDRFDRVNLCPRAWDELEARSRAATLFVEAHARGVPIVLLGAKVTRASGTDFVPFTVLARTSLCPTRVVLPHPSGLARAWHAPGAYERARAVLRGAGVLS